MFIHDFLEAPSTETGGIDLKLRLNPVTWFIDVGSEIEMITAITGKNRSLARVKPEAKIFGKGCEVGVEQSKGNFSTRQVRQR